MKKGIFLLASITMLMLAGCGDSSGATSVGSNTGSNTGTTTVDNQLKIDNGNVAETTITNEFGLNPALGTPPPLPAS